MDENITEINIDLDAMLDELVMMLREKQGDGEQVLAMLKELSRIADKIDSLMNEQVAIPVELVDDWNRLIAVLYPDKEPDKEKD